MKFDRFMFGFNTILLCFALVFGVWEAAVLFASTSIGYGYLIYTHKKEEATEMIKPAVPFEVDYFGCEEGAMEANIALVALDFATDPYKAPDQQDAAIDYLDRYIRSGL